MTNLGPTVNGIPLLDYARTRAKAMAQVCCLCSAPTDPGNFGMYAPDGEARLRLGHDVVIYLLCDAHASDMRGRKRAEIMRRVEESIEVRATLRDRSGHCVSCRKPLTNRENPNTNESEGAEGIVYFGHCANCRGEKLQ